jgi:hypothetical protein
MKLLYYNFYTITYSVIYVVCYFILSYNYFLQLKMFKATAEGDDAKAESYISYYISNKRFLRLVIFFSYFVYIVLAIAIFKEGLVVPVIVAFVLWAIKQFITYLMIKTIRPRSGI